MMQGGNNQGKFTNQGEVKAWWRPGMEIFAKVSGWIAAPIIVSLFLGRWLDQKYNTKPWIFLGLTAIAFAISMFGIVRESMSFFRSLESEAKKEEKNPESNK